MKQRESNKNKDAIIKADCNKCAMISNHQILQSIAVYEDTVDKHWTKDSYEIICCQECETISFRHYHENSKDTIFDHYTSSIENVPTVRQYP